MSVIADALKKAQRERLRRATAASGIPVSGPLVVQLRATHPARVSWTSALGLGVGAAAVIALVALVIQLRRTSERSSLPAVPPPPASERIVPSTASSAPSVGRSHIAESAASGPGGALMQSGRSPGPSANPGPATPALRSVTSTVDAGATPQGDARGDSAVGRRVRPADRLLISVDGPRDIAYTQLFEQAVVAHRSNDTATARSLYERLLGMAPNDPDLLNNFGVLMSSAGEFGRATELLQRAVKIAPGNASGWANLGYSFREQGKPTESIAAFQRALALDPRRPGVRVNIAQQYMAIGSLSQAREAVDRILADDPMSAEAHYTLGQLLEIQGERAGAAREYAEFLRLAPPRLASYVHRVRQHLDSLGVRLPD